MLTRGVTLREIHPPRPKSGEHPGEHPWVTAFLQALGQEDVASVTVRGYRSDLRLFAAWYDGQPMEKLTASDLAHFRQYLSRERAMKPASVNRKLEALRRFCRWAHTTGKLCTNVAAGHETFRLRVVKSTTKAVAFYKRMGWRAEREFPHETLPTTMLEMVKTVPPPVITSSGVDLAYNTLE